MNTHDAFKQLTDLYPTPSSDDRFQGELESFFEKTLPAFHQMSRERFEFFNPVLGRGCFRLDLDSGNVTWQGSDEDAYRTLCTAAVLHRLMTHGNGDPKAQNLLNRDAKGWCKNLRKCSGIEADSEIGKGYVVQAQGLVGKKK